MLLGDAGHPMLQYAAQGAAQALEDAFALAVAYKRHGPSKLEAVFREYEEERMPRSTKVMELAREIGNFAHQSGSAKTVRDAMLRMHDMYDYECLQWLYAEQQKESQ